MDGKRPAALSDAALDRQLDAALNVDAPPEFLAQVRMRVAAETRRRGWVAHWGWIAAAAAAAVIIVTVLSVRPNRETVAPREASAPQPLVHESAPPVAPPVIAEAPSRERGTAAATVAQVDRRPEPASAPAGMPPFPKVLVSEDEVRAYARLLGVAVEQRLPPPTIAARDEETTLELDNIELASLRIEALPPLARLEGERR